MLGVIHLTTRPIMSVTASEAEIPLLDKFGQKQTDR